MNFDRPRLVVRLCRRTPLSTVLMRSIPTAFVGRARIGAFLLGSTALVGIALSTPASAASLNWTGATSVDWFTAGNWSPAAVPGGADTVTIDTQAPFQALILSAGAQSGVLTVGESGTGTLIISNGGTLASDASTLGNAAGSQGTATIDGAGSEWNLGIHSLTVGHNGIGAITVSAGGTLLSDTGSLGDAPGGTGTVTVDGVGSSWTATHNILVGNASVPGNASIGTLNIRNGGTVTATGITAGNTSSSSGTILVTGVDSTLTDNGVLVVGSTGIATLTIADGGSATSDTALIGVNVGFVSMVTVKDAGSSWTNANGIVVGRAGSAVLNILNGGTVNAVNADFGQLAGGTGGVVIDGAGSLLNDGGTITVGGSGGGLLRLTNGGSAGATNGLVLASQAGSRGTLIIGNDLGPAGGSGSLTPSTATVTFGAGTGKIMFNHTNANYAFAPVISGAGEIDQLAGVTHLTGNSSAFSGPVKITGGTLFVDSTVGSGTNTFTVASGGRIGGTGFAAGTVTVANGATLVGVQGQTLGIGTLVLNNTSNVDVTLSDPSATRLFAVANGLTLDGNLNITAAGAFGPGVYRLFDYAGTFVDNGLNIGTTPDGTTAADFSVQTSIASHQVNLIDTAAAQLRFWDGSNPANANNSMVDGGSGNWSVTSTSFTDGNGVNNGVQTPQPGFVVFQGNAGTVTIDNSSGAVAVTGMQFASNGYLINGDPLTLAKAQTTIRVGDGTAAGSNYVATIAASLTGTGGLEKTDLGILALSGVNTYTGETRITAGLLALVGNGSIATSSRVVDNGVFDIFFTTNGASITSLSGSGKVTLGSQTLTVTQANDDFSGVIDGPGGLTVSGGLQSLSGVNTYSGVTTISGGTLALSGAGSIAASGGVVANGVFDISGTTAGATIAALSGTGSVVLGAQTLTMSNNFNTGDFFSGVISGSGGLNLQNGFFGLSGANTYTGLTTIANSASLLLGNAAASGSIVGDVANSGILGFSQSGVTTMSGAIFGSGRVLQAGLGTTTLAGVNTYTGGTIIAVGLLRGSATSFGSGEVTNDAAFEINQATNAAFSNVISGTGNFTKSGAGSLDLTGTSTMTGVTTVADGRLAVNGSLASSIVTIQSGGTLGGNGVVGGVVAQGGSVVGPGNSIGTLTVVGNYNQASGSTYQVEVTTTGHNDRINVTGTATIASGAKLNVVKTDPGLYVLGKRYTVLTATGGVNGTYTLSGDTSAFYGLVANYDANDVYLDVIHKKTFAEAGRTRNQIDTGGGLDGLPATNPLVTAVGKLPTDATAQVALDQLSGESHASFKTALIEDSRFVRDAAINRVRAAFDALGASNAAAYAYDQQSTPQAVAANSGGLAFWGQGVGAWGSTDGDSNASHLGRATSGLLMGGDAPVLDGWRLGVMAGYSRIDVNTAASNASGTSDNYHLGIYTGTQIGALGIRGGAAYSRNEMHLNRSVSFAGFGDKLTSGYDGGTAQAFGELGYRLDAGHLTFEPFGGLAYVSLQTDGFAEHGGPAALTARGDTTDVTFITLGLRGSSVMEIAGASVTTKGTLGWRHAYGDVTPISTLAFAGGSAFAVFGVPIARDSMVVDAGFDTALTRDILIGVSYSGQIAASARDNGFKANLNWRF
jgi:fibronectin-binding autotransporter adhesin